MESVHGPRLEDPIEIHVEIDVSEVEIRETLLPRAALVELHDLLPDLETDHWMVRVRSRHTKREMCVRAAQLHLQGCVDGEPRWTTIRERPRDLKIQPQRIDMLPDGTHRARRLSRVVVRSSGAETLYRRPTVTYDWKVSSRPTARDIPANHPGISPLLDTLHDLLGIAAHEAYARGEVAGLSAWNPLIWPFRAVWLLGFALLALQVFAEAAKSLLALVSGHDQGEVQ